MVDLSSLAGALPAGDFFTFRNVIGGDLRSAAELHQGTNPSDLTKLWDVPMAEEADLNDAVKSAKKAFPAWSQQSWESRQEVLAKLRDLLLANKENLSKVCKLEGGKPTFLADAEIDHSAGFLDFYSKQPPLDEEHVQDDEDIKISIHHTPIGVVGAITPWNFPIVLAIAKICAALLTGNCVIVKPSPYTPYSILKVAELAQKVVPEGVFQALNGADKLGPLITDHPGIGKITFTGSTATGRKIMASSAKTLKNVTLELGGNSASIICEDVDIPFVASQVALGSFFNSGQLCVASKRLYVHESIYDKFREALAGVVGSWKYGNVAEEGVMIGPVQNEMQYNIVKSFFEDSYKNGHKFALGGEWKDTKSFVVQPTIVDNPPDDSKIVAEEPFGPIVPMLKWSTEDEVIQRVNDTSSGLSGAVWSGDVERAQKLGRRIEAGTIWINSYEKPVPQGYFSGHKESGIGGEWGRKGLYSYCNAQCTHVYKNKI